jgi:hypothetical protein
VNTAMKLRVSQNCGKFLEWLRNSEYQLHHRVVDEWLYVLVYLWTVSSVLHEKVR